MNVWNYRACDAQGRIMRGRMDAHGVRINRALGSLMAEILQAVLRQGFQLLLPKGVGFLEQGLSSADELAHVMDTTGMDAAS